MSEIQESNYGQMKSFIERNDWPFSEKMEGTTNRIDVKQGKHKCVVKVYGTGTIQLQGGESKLKAALTEA